MRVLGPLVGGTLNAAKLLNIGSVVVTCVALWTALRAQSVSTAWRYSAVCFFALSYPTYVTAWAEFGDPLALAFFATGVALLLSRTTRGALVAAGALVGVAGLVRLHFQTMGWGTAIAFAGLAFARSNRADAIRATALFTGAVIAGQLPVFALNLTAHGTLFSPIAHAFIGQVLFGANAHDMGNSYAAAPFDGLFSAHGLLLLSVISDRLLEMPLGAVFVLVIATMSLLGRDEGGNVRAFAVLLALGYYVGFVAPSWGITPRLLMGFMFPVALALGMTGKWFGTFCNARASAVVASLVLVATALHFRGERRAIRAVRNQTRAAWDRNVEITRAIRSKGIQLPVEVFASNWFVYPTDDPEMVGFYNFGFWNLLVPEFAAERPNPYVTINDAAAFESFLMQRGVRALVLDADPALPAAVAIVRGDYKLRHYRADGVFGDQHFFVHDSQ